MQRVLQYLRVADFMLAGGDLTGAHCSLVTAWGLLWAMPESPLRNQRLALIGEAIANVNAARYAGR